MTMVPEEEGTDPQAGTRAAARSGAPSWQAFPATASLALDLAIPPAGRTFEELAEPFVPLGERGRFTRTLAATVTGPTGGPLLEVALRIQSDEYAVPSLAEWTNLEVDAQLARQYDLLRASSAAGGSPRLLEILAPSRAGGPPCLPPTLFCKTKRAFFPAPCPECGAGLQVCRDDGLLETKGLPRYDRSLERFLYCAHCSGTSPQHRFFTLLSSDPDLPSRAPVGEQTDLYAALGSLARGGGPLPCHGCDQVDICHPASGIGEARRRLTSLSFYDFTCVVTERCDLHYDDFVRVIGMGAGDGEGRAPGGGSRRGARRRFLFEGDPRGKLPLEILRLKLGVFAQVVDAVRQIHHATRQPHLGLAPENLMVRVGRPAHGLPALYRTEVRVLGVGSSLERRLAGLDASGLVSPLLVPPPLRADLFASSLLSSKTMPQDVEMRVLSVAEDGTGRSVVEVEITSGGFDLSSVSFKDALHVRVRQAKPLPLNVELLGNPVRREEEALVLRSVALRADHSHLRSLRDLIGQEAIQATCIVYPCLHVPCDIESLGILLFTTLAANATSPPPARIARFAHRLADQVLAFVDDHPTAGGEDVGAFASDCIRREGDGGWLAVQNLYEEPGRFPSTAAPAVDPYWNAALVLALRALTRTPGFGFCRSHDDFDPAHPEGPADHFLSELEILGQKVDDELLQMRGRQEEMAEAIRRVRDEASAGGRA